MSTNATQVLATLLTQLTGVHVAAGKLHGSLQSIKTAAIGAGAAFVGWEIGKGLWNATKHAEKLNHELVKLQTGARLTDAQTEDAKLLAFKTSREVKGTASDENTKMTRELFGVFGNMDEAKRLMPLVALGSQVVRNFTDVKGVDLAQIAMKTLELRGHMTKDHKVDEGEFNKEFGSMVRSIVASEGLIDPQKLYMATRQAGPAARVMNGDEFWGKFPAIMNALGSGPAGTAMMSLFSQLVGHVVAGARVAKAEEAAGMLTPGKWRVKRGGKVEMDQDATPDQAGFMDHPVTWLHNKLLKMREQKDKHGNKIDEVGIIQEIFQISSRATSARLISDIDANWALIETEEARYKRMPSPDVIKKEQDDKDLSVNIHNLTEAWGAFMAALGGPGIPVAISVLHGMTDSINYFQEMIIKHPDIAKDLFYLAGGLSALLITAGTITVFTIAFSPFVKGIRLLAGITGLAATGTSVGAVASGMNLLAAALIPFAAGGAAALGIAYLMDQLHGWAGFGNKNGFTPMTGGPAQGALPGNGYTTRPAGVAPMPGDNDFRVPLPPSSRHDTENHGPVRVIVTNGKDIANGVFDYGADRMSRAPNGRSVADPRMSPLMPGMSLFGGF